MASTNPSQHDPAAPDGGQAISALSALVRLLARVAAREAWDEADHRDRPDARPAVDSPGAGTSP